MALGFCKKQTVQGRLNNVYISLCEFFCSEKVNIFQFYLKIDSKYYSSIQ